MAIWHASAISVKEIIYFRMTNKINGNRQDQDKQLDEEHMKVVFHSLLLPTDDHEFDQKQKYSFWEVKFV